MIFRLFFNRFVFVWLQSWLKKVPKREIFDLLGFLLFLQHKPLLVGDCGAVIFFCYIIAILSAKYLVVHSCFAVENC
jgi:hypothetical protein